MTVATDKFKGRSLSDMLTLYLVSDRSWLKDGETLESVVEEAILGGASAIQLREKNITKQDFLEKAKAIKKITDTYNVLFIVNDDADVAIEVGADGVHLGASDSAIAEVRKIAPKDFIIGSSARSVDIAKRAEADGADYLGVGAVFGTATKSDAKTISVDVLSDIVKAVDIPVVAIGGVNYKNILELRGSGVAGAAILSGILKADDKRRESERLLSLMKEVKNG